MKLYGLLRQLSYLKTTVRSSYGKGVKAWAKLIYYSFFRINKFIIMRINLDNQNVTENTLQGVSFFLNHQHDLATHRSMVKLPREFFCDQFHKVSNCCLGMYYGEIAYIHWIYFQGDFSRFLKIGNDSAEISYVITLPEYRGHGISTAAFCYSLMWLKERGIRNVFAVVHEDNTASLKSFAKAGFANVGSTFSFGLFNRKVLV